MKFKVDDLVVEKSHLSANTSYCVSKVVIIYNDSYLIDHYGTAYPQKDGMEFHEDDWEEFREPGSRGYREGFQRFQESELLSYDESVEEMKRLAEGKNALEAQFDSIKSQVEIKMKAAAALVEEANALVLPLDKDLCDLRKECMPLYNALDDGGWRSSNFRC